MHRKRLLYALAAKVQCEHPFGYLVHERPSVLSVYGADSWEKLGANALSQGRPVVPGWTHKPSVNTNSGTFYVNSPLHCPSMVWTLSQGKPVVPGWAHDPSVNTHSAKFTTALCTVRLPRFGATLEDSFLNYQLWDLVYAWVGVVPLWRWGCSCQESFKVWTCSSLRFTPAVNKLKCTHPWCCEFAGVTGFA